MAKFMSVVLFLLVVILAALGAVVYIENPGDVAVQLPLGYKLTASFVELLGGALGVGVLFGWIVVWTRNLRRARKAAMAAAQQMETLVAADEGEPGEATEPPETEKPADTEATVPAGETE